MARAHRGRPPSVRSLPVHAEREELGLAGRETVLEVTRQALAGDRVVEVCRMVLRADAYRLRYHLPA